MAEIWKDSVSGRRIADAVKPICVLDDGGKGMKKPDKLLACPRCSSLDTKFCYFNNCNVSQPRHFCKRCQRYWTSGGTMRNVPVGSGCRKGKHSSAFSHPRFRNRARSNSLEESTLQFPQQDTARHLQMGCSVQEFCSVSPMSPSDAIPVLSYGKEAETGSASDEQEVTSEKEKLASSSSSVGTQIISSKQLAAMEQSFAAAELFMRGYPLSFPMGLWPYGYGPFPAPISPMIPHAFAIPPWPLMPIPPWGRPAENAPPFREGGAGEGFPLTPLTPKTLRIHHPAEAAQSSIWSALGIDYKSDFPISVGAIFDGFPLKAVVAGTEEPPTVDAICSNPATMTRSAAFHENS